MAASQARLQGRYIPDPFGKMADAWAKVALAARKLNVNAAHF
jgi:hypothetical protein